MMDYQFGEYFDIFGYRIDYKRYFTCNKKVPGKFVDERKRNTVIEFIVLRLKFYFYSIEKEVKRIIKSE